MAERKYPKIRDSRWIQPVAKGYHMACCDCALVHRLDFRIVDDRVQFRAFRAVGETKKLRKRQGIIVR